MKLNVYTSSFFNRMNFVGIYSSGFLRAVVILLYLGDCSLRFFFNRRKFGSCFLRSGAYRYSRLEMLMTSVVLRSKERLKKTLTNATSITTQQQV